MFNKLKFNFQNIKLVKKLTILLLAIFIGGMTFSSIALAHILNYKAQEEISSQGWLLFRTINSVRSYTNDEVNPEFEKFLGNDEFLAQSIPSYSSRRVFEKLQADNEDYKDFLYKEAMLNPTNLKDKADSFETGLIEQFRQSQNLQELSGFRLFQGTRLFYIAHPLAITESRCLRCHSTPDIAPKKMIDIYGKENGFGWKLNEIVGAQIVSIPASEVLQKARQSFFVVMGMVTVIFAIAIYMTNIWLKRYVIRPIKRVVSVAEVVSTGDLDAEFEKTSNDEIGSLVEAFTRMKLSLVIAIKNLEQYIQGKNEE
jgi:methyl-accepting chemotaxis protein